MCNETLVPLTKFADVNIKTLLILDILPGIGTIVGNFIFILTLIRTSSLHRQSNVLLGSLCVSDLLVGFIVRPLYVAFLLKMVIHSEMNLQLKSAFAKLFLYCGGLSFGFAAQVGLDRYTAICHPFFYHRYITCKKYVISTIISCTVWLGFISLNFDRRIGNSTLYNMVQLTYIVVTISIILICYVKILQVIRKQKKLKPSLGKIDGKEREIDIQEKNERSKTYMVAVILGIFLLSYTPCVVLLVYFAIRKGGGCWNSDGVFVANSWVNVIALWNSGMNPVIYCALSSQILDACKRVIYRTAN